MFIKPTLTDLIPSYADSYDEIISVKGQFKNGQAILIDCLRVKSFHWQYGIKAWEQDCQWGLGLINPHCRNLAFLLEHLGATYGRRLYLMENQPQTEGWIFSAITREFACANTMHYGKIARDCRTYIAVAQRGIR